MKRHLHPLMTQTVLAALMLALLAFPFVHRSGAEPVSPAISQFISMGGNLADICGERGGHRAGGCESCTIAAAAMLPSHAQIPHPAFASLPLATDMSGTIAARLPAPHITPPVRAPPRA